MVLFIMSYTQLVVPNLSVAGLPDYCLAYVQSVFNVPASDPHDPDAWQGWLDTQFKHEDRNLPNVAVPIWCAWSGTVEGVYSNYGHVAVWTGSEVYTNPLSGSGHKVFPSIAAMETAYGVQYVGWSEDIETLRVAKGGTLMVDQPLLKLLFQGILLRDPDPSAQAYIGLPVDVVTTQLIQSQEHAEIVAGWQNQAVNRDSALKYVQANLK